MNYQMDGLNSMPWHALALDDTDVKIEFTDIPPRNKFKYKYDLWTNGLSRDAFGIGRTYRASMRSRSRGNGIWMFNFDSTGRLINSSFSGKEWESSALPSNKKHLGNITLGYPEQYRPEMHRLLGGTWIQGKWEDSEKRTNLVYTPDVLSKDNPFYKMTMNALDLFVEHLKKANLYQQDQPTATILKKLVTLPVLTSAELEDEVQRFRKIIGTDDVIPVEPPELALDHYHALPLFVENGCGGKCTFCDLYNRKIKISKPEEVFKRIDDLSDYLQEESDHFELMVLMEGDALVVPTEQLGSYLTYAREKFDFKRERFAHCFSKETTVRDKSISDLKKLRQYGLTNVNMGLETGHQPLLSQIKRGQELANFRAAVLKLIEADINVSINFIAGIGGKQYQNAHVEETISFIRTLPNSVRSFFAPLYVPEKCKYQRQQKEMQPLTTEEIEQQCNIFRKELNASEYLFIPV